MKLIELKTNSKVLAKRKAGAVALGRAVQAESKGLIAFTWKGVRVGDLDDGEIPAKVSKAVTDVMAKVLEHPLRPGLYPLEDLLKLAKSGKGDLVGKLYKSNLQFVSEDTLASIEERSLKVFLLGSAGTGVVSAVQDMVSAFTSAGYYGRAFPQFDPSKKGAPVRGFGIVSRDPIRSHASFEAPDIVILFDQKMFPLLRETLAGYPGVDPATMAILINTPLSPADFREAADFRAAHPLYTIDADALVRGKRIPPNYAMIGALLGILGTKAVDRPAFVEVVKGALTAKFSEKVKVDTNLTAFTKAIEQVHGEGKEPFRSAALGRVKPHSVPAHQQFMFEDGNRAISRAMAAVLNQFPSVVAAYPITPQTQVVEYLAQMIADGDISAESVTPESEHGAGGAVLGAARDRVLCFTATCSQGFALMSEVVHTIGGMRMGNVVISNVLRSLNAPLDVENDHGDLYKVGLDAGFLVFMTRDVQQAYDFHLIAYLVSLYAEYRDLGEGRLEMSPSRCIMLPAIVASEGFEVSHAPEGYLLLADSVVKKLYDDPAFSYVKRFVDTPNYSIMGTLQLSNSRLDTDFQRHQAMQLALEVIPTVLAKFAKLSGRSYDVVTAFNPEADDLFVVAGAANGTFEEVARQLGRQGQSIGVLHPNLLRPFPKKEWAKVLEGKRVFVYDRDDPYGAVGGRLYTELAGVVNEFQLEGTRLYSRIYGLGGRTPTLSLVRDEILKALRGDEIAPEPAKQYVGVNL